MAEKYSLKDHLFNPETVGRLGLEFEQAGVFPAAPFVADVLKDMAPLELKARINLIADVLARHLPSDFDAACDAILAALPAPLDPALSDDDFGHFIHAPLGVYVEKNGLEAHKDRSLDVLEAVTQRFSMEFSIRAFLNRWPDETLARMQDWITHDHYHVRRLVSEGTRPKLPWGQGIGLTVAQTLPLLDKLHADPTRFVTRSVANHLNDITKIAPEMVVERLENWQSQAKQADKELLWMRKHALRGLIKEGHADAMVHLGYRPDVDVTVSDFSIAPDSISRGDAAQIALSLTAENDAPLIVDYVIDFMKANGATAPKVFKMKVLDAKAGRPIKLAKRHVFKADATTFKLHPGAHQVSIQVNGRIIATRPFKLT
jgi:3-methyladenine DNA glycosylase AlkC